MDGAELVGGGDEQDARQIDRDLHVVVPEGVILRRVEDLEQRRRRVPLDADRNLVDLVEHQDRIGRLGGLQRLDQPAGHGADVGAAVAADFRFVAHPAERDAHEVAVHRPGDGLAERRLADPRRADEAQDRPFHPDPRRGWGRLLNGPRRRRRGLAAVGGATAAQRLDREVFDDPLLDLVEIVVIRVEHLARLDRIEPILGALLPRHIEDPVEIGADHLVLGRGRRHPLQAIDFARGDRRHRLGQRGLGDARADFGRLAVAFAELGLDRLHLLAQQILPLRVGHFLFRLRLDLALELEHFDFARQHHRDRIELDRDAVLLEQALLVLGLHVEQAGEQIGDAQRIVEPHHQRLDVRGEAGGERQRPIDELLQPPDAGVDVDGAFGRFGERLEQRPDEAMVRLQELGPRPRHAFDQHADTVRPFGHLPDDRDRADAVQVVGAGLLRVALLQKEQHHAVAAERAVDGFDRYAGG